MADGHKTSSGHGPGAIAARYRLMAAAWACGAPGAQRQHTYLPISPAFHEVLRSLRDSIFLKHVLQVGWQCLKLVCRLMQQGTMRKDQLASRVSFSPSPLPSHKSMHSRMQSASPYGDAMLHSQNNSMDAVFSRITGQPGATMAYEPSPEEQAPTSPGIFEKWRSALVTSLDHDAGGMDADHHNEAEQPHEQFSNRETSFVTSHQAYDSDFLDHTSSAVHHQSPEMTGPLLPLSRQSSRPVSPSRAGQWVKVGSPESSRAHSASAVAAAVAEKLPSPLPSSGRATGMPMASNTEGDMGDAGDVRRRVIRKSASQSSLSSLMAQAAGPSSGPHGTREVAVPQPGSPHSTLSRPGSAGALNKSRLSKMSTPDLQALGLAAQPGQEMSPLQDGPQASRSHHADTADGSSASSGNGPSAAPVTDNERKRDEQQTRSMAASLEEMLSKVWT